MQITTDNGVTVITPETGKRLTDGNTILPLEASAYLGVDDSPDNWAEITELKDSIVNCNSSIIPNGNGTEVKLSKVHDDVLDKAVLSWSYDTDDYCGGTVLCNPQGRYNEVEIQYKSESTVPLKLQLNDHISVIVSLDCTDGDYATIRQSLPNDMCINNVEIYIQSNSGQIKGDLYISDISLIG